MGSGPNCPGPNCPPPKSGKLGPGQLGPGAQLSGAQLSVANWAPDNWAPGPGCPGPSCPGPNCPGPDCPGPNLPRTANDAIVGHRNHQGFEYCGFLRAIRSAVVRNFFCKLVVDRQKIFPRWSFLQWWMILGTTASYAWHHQSYFQGEHFCYWGRF